MGKKAAIFDAFREVEGTAMSTTYANVGGVLVSDALIVYVFNTCNDTIIISFDGGTTDHFKLDASEAATLVLKPSDIVVPKDAQIQVKDAGSTPGSGSLRITIARA